MIISGNRILTNAHVVSHASSITVQAFQSATKVPAKVIAISGSMDLALLAIEKEGFFDSHPALPFDDELPSVRSTVNAYGFPFGGTQISVTEGIVSRIEFQKYYFSSQGLRIQIDAALNPGNSGGPAVKDGRMVGIVFSGISEGDNIGYLIPIEEVRLFLDDVKDGTYDGKLRLSREIQTLENDAIRRKLGLSEDMGGVMISELGDVGGRVLRGVQAWDVITKIDGHPIDREGKVKLGDDNRVVMAYLIQKHTDNDIVKMTLLRDGKQIDVDVKLTRQTRWLAGAIEYAYPQYFIAGPMLFMPASAELVRGLSVSRRWYVYLMYRQSPLVSRAFERLSESQDEELVVTGSGFLPHPITQGYSDPQYAVVDKFNGVQVKNLAQLIELMRESQDEYFIFEFAGTGYETLVFDRAEFLDATEKVLDDNGIRRQATENYLEIWNRS